MKFSWVLLLATILPFSQSAFADTDAVAAPKMSIEDVKNPGKDAPLALVYRGPGSCSDGDCSKVAANLMRKAGFRTLYIRPSEITPKILAAARVWVQPGGDALRVRAAMSKKAFEALKEFIYDGGNYIGFCAGAFLASPWLDDNDTLPGLNIVPAYDIDHTHGDERPRVEPIVWHGKSRYVYYQGGAAFRVGPENQHIVQATYLDGTAVIVYNTYGKGHVAVSGAHPEAPKAWFDDDHLDQKDDTTDIALEMVSWISK